MAGALASQPRRPGLRVLDTALDLVVAIALFGELGAIIADVLGRALFDRRCYGPTRSPAWR